MRKYNRRILTALVVAYKRGIINRKPLNKWLNLNQVLTNSMKYISYLVLFSVIFVILDQHIFNYEILNQNVYIGGYIIAKSRILSGIIIGILAFNLYRLGKYLMQVYFVKKAMKVYKTSDGDVEKLNNVTFKIHI